jgi:hypothetical protein
MQAAIFDAGCLVNRVCSDYTCIVSAEANAKQEKGSTVKLS